MVPEELERDALEHSLRKKIKTLNEVLWERRLGSGRLQDWLDNFSGDHQLEALYLLSQFLYFGEREIRQMLRSLYRDLFRQRVLKLIRSENSDLGANELIESLRQHEESTLFTGLGNPSESGCHLLYYFRQENRLRKSRFEAVHRFFSRDKNTGQAIARFPSVRHYVFLDDLCASGDQAAEYLEDIVPNLKDTAPDAFVYFFSLVGTSNGMSRLRDVSEVDHVDCVFELDDSYRVFSGTRCFHGAPKTISKEKARVMLDEYQSSFEVDILGYDKSELLVGFRYNTPDNTLPMIWSTKNGWIPAFRRYHKWY